MENKSQQRNSIEDALRDFRLTGKIDCSDITVREENGLWWIEAQVPMVEGKYPKDEIDNIKKRLIDYIDYEESDLEIKDSGQDADMHFETENPATDYVKLQVVDRR